MAQELCYTSAPRGLDPGVSGFCTVAVTRGMPEPMVRRLEALSGYRALPGAQAAAGGAEPDAVSPTDWAYRPMRIGGEPWCVLSRVAYAGADYSGRPNKFAHHLAARPGECPTAGPAWVLRQRGVMREQWEGEPAFIDELRSLPRGDRPPAVCRAWERVAGDAGWAGVLAEAFLLDRSKPAYLVYDHRTTDLLTLLEEAVALLPESVRWSVSFTTYAGQGGAQDAVWRGVVAGSPAEAHVPGADAGWALVLDLRRPLGSAGVGRYAEMARLGHAPAPVAVAAVPTEAPEPGAEPYELSAPAPGTSRLPRGARPQPAPPDAAGAAAARAPVTSPPGPTARRWGGWLWFGWPVLVLAAAGWLVLGDTGSAPRADAPSVERVRELEAALAERDATIDRLRRALDGAGGAPAGGGAAAPERSDGPDPPAAPRGAPDPDGADPASRGSGAETPPSPRDGARAPSEPVSINPGGYATALPGFADHFVADPPPPPVQLGGPARSGEGGALLIGLPAGAVLTAHGPPAGAVRGVSLVPDDSGRGVTVVARRVDALGRAAESALARLTPEAGELRWRWASGGDAGGRLAEAGVAEVLRQAVVRVHAGSPGGGVLATVQFVGPAEHAWTLGEPSGPAMLPEGFRGEQLRLAAVSSPRGWTASAGGAGRVLRAVSRGGAAARAEIVGLGAGSSGQPRVGVVMGWESDAGPGALASSLTEARDAAQRLGEQAARMSRLMQQRDEAESALPRGADGGIDWSAAEAEARFREPAERWRSAGSALEALRDEAGGRGPSELRAAADAADARARRLAEALADTRRGGAFTILVVAPGSGAVVGRCRVALPDEAPPAPAVGASTASPTPALGRAGRRPGGSL